MTGPPVGPPAAELIEAGFELENADAPILHHGMNLADLAHLLDLASAGVIPPDAARRLLALLLEVMQIPARDFPYDPANGFAQFRTNIEGNDVRISGHDRYFNAYSESLRNMAYIVSGHGDAVSQWGG